LNTKEAVFWLKQKISPDFNLRSRIHPLKTYIRPYKDSVRVYIKREDELSSGITGSKLRKFASLIAFFREDPPDEILLIGSAQSNNIPGILQLLNENGFRSRLMLLESNEKDLKGNLLWMQLLHDFKDVIWVKREDWPQVSHLADEYAASQPERKIFVLPEGAACPEALPGAMSLAGDIKRNEEEINLHFNHIFIDSGSGTAAIGLLLGINLFWNAGKHPNVHITLIAGTEEEFSAQYLRLRDGVPELKGSVYPANVHFYKPSVSSSFGSVTKTILKESLHIARQEGILIDPVYSVKHLMTAREAILQQELKGDILIVHSGGALSLAGYQPKLAGLF
jgi:1-aminocyclopropane-1-carboxylate deaminase/D-cysteine desulfhydrase-like pyridoxal-dependent ACC family enzyme